MTPDEIKVAKDKIISTTQLERGFLKGYRVSPDKDDLYMCHGETGFMPRIELSTLLSDYREWLIFNGHLKQQIMEDIVPGYNEAKESLLAKLEEPISMYLITKLKMDLFRGRDDQYCVQRELKENMLFHARQIDEILLQDIENQ